MGLSVAVANNPHWPYGGANPLALMRSLIDDNGGVLYDFQETSGAVAEAYNSALAVGRNSVINGDFATDTIWTKGTGWTIAAGVADCDGSQGASTLLNQTAPLSVGATYRVTFTLAGYSAGSVTVKVGGTSGTARASNNTYVQNIVAGSTNSFIQFSGSTLFVGTIDNVIVEQLDILASSAYPGAELYVTANAASDPNGNEADDTAGWGTIGTVALTSDASVKSIGDFSIKCVPSSNAAGIFFDLNTILTIGNRYNLSFATRHLGTGGINGAYLSDTSNGITTELVSLDNTDTVFQTVTLEFSHSATTRYLVARERSATNDGGVYLDNISITEANPLNAATTGATVAQPGPAGLLAYSFDGTNDYVDAYSAELNSILDPALWTQGIYGKVSGAGVWSDNTLRVLLNWQADANNYMRLSKNTSNELQWDYMAGGTLESVVLATTPTEWFAMWITINAAGNMTAYYNGVITGSAQAIAGTWVGNLASTTTTIGALNTTPASGWDGLLSLVPGYNVEDTGASILQAAQAGGVA